MIRARALAATATLALAACAPNVVRIGTPDRFDYFCGGAKQVNLSGMESILTSTDDRAVGAPRDAAAVTAIVRASGGAIAYWKDQPVRMPGLAARFGEKDGFVRVRALAVSTPTAAQTAAQKREIFVLARDRGVDRWITMTAFDVQDVCVTGRRQS